MRIIRHAWPLLFCLGGMAWQAARAAPEISIQVLFEDKVLALIDGRSQMLRVGEDGPRGVKLIHSDSEEAVLEVDGRQQVYTLGSSLSNRPPPDTAASLKIPQDQRTGAYLATCQFNGTPSRCVLDTGASLVTLNSVEAKSLGIAYRDSPPEKVETASGVTHAYPVLLQSVRVGDIELRQVQALVVEGEFPSVALLGMNFLGQLEMRHDQNTLELKEKAR